MDSRCSVSVINPSAFTACDVEEHTSRYVDGCVTLSLLVFMLTHEVILCRGSDRAFSCLFHSVCRTAKRLFIKLM